MMAKKRKQRVVLEVIATNPITEKEAVLRVRRAIHLIQGGLSIEGLVTKTSNIKQFSRVNTAENIRRERR